MPKLLTGNNNKLYYQSWFINLIVRKLHSIYIETELKKS